MSKEQAKEFFYEVAKNKELAEKVSQLLGGTASKEAVAEKLISVAKEYGFNFTKEEAAVAQSDFKIPLSEDELADVSGGWGFSWLVAPVLSLFSAFLGGTEAQPQQSVAMDSPTTVQESRAEEQHEGVVDNIFTSGKQDAQIQQTASTVEKLQKQWSSMRTDLERYNKVLKEEVVPTNDTIFSAEKVNEFVSELDRLIEVYTENMQLEDLNNLINETEIVMKNLLDFGIQERDKQEAMLNKLTKHATLSANIASEVKLFKSSSNLTIGSAVFSRAIWAHNLNEKVKPDLAAQKITDQYGFTVDYKFNYETGELFIEGTGEDCEFTADAYFKIKDNIRNLGTVTKVRIEKVTNVDSGVFSSDKNLKAVYLGKDVKTVKGFADCDNLKWLCYESEEMPEADSILTKTMKITDGEFSKVSENITFNDFWNKL